MIIRGGSSLRLRNVTQESLFDQAREEADAIIAEAKDQAQKLLEAADSKAVQIKQEGTELASHIEGAIETLTQILADLRKRLG